MGKKILELGTCGDNMMVVGIDEVLEFFNVGNDVKLVEGTTFCLNGVMVNDVGSLGIVSTDNEDEYKVVCKDLDGNVLCTTKSLNGGKHFIEIKSYSKEVFIDIRTRESGWWIEEKDEKRLFPLWKVEFVQNIYNGKYDCDKSGSVNYYKRSGKDEVWTKEYSEGFRDFSFGFNRAGVTIYDLMERDILLPKEDTCMFEYHDRMFTLTHFFNDSKCVCGECIDDFYNDYEGDNSIKVDIIKSHVFFYEKDTLVIRHKKLYLNGKVVGNGRDLLVNYGLEYYQVENMYGKSKDGRDVKEILKELYPDAISYTSWGASGSM